ncbi:MAG: T9SS type A sorting domain-containing protein [Bacteroidota bacterium]
MKKILHVLFTLFALQSFAQTMEDSVSMGTGIPSYPLDVYYNVTNGAKDTVRNNNWHLAFAVRSAQPPLNVARAACVRINEARGVQVFVPPTTQNWNTFDTSGWQSWRRLRDSDTSWDIGAFNDGYFVQQFNFGWGTYNMTTRHIDGQKTFLIRIQQGQNAVWRKFKVMQLSFDTTWYAASANIDGTDSAAITITKGNYAGKLFAYYNLLNKTVVDREPSTPWHLLWSRYFTRVNVFGIDTFYTVTGILQHPTIRTARVSSVDTDSAAFNDAEGKYTTLINIIGWDWKVSPQGPPSTTPWELVDSLSFFVKTAEMTDSAYKLVMTKFTGPNPQITIFNKTLMAKPKPTVGVEKLSAGKIKLMVYPNPAHTEVYVATEENEATAYITDLTGRTVYQQSTLSGTIRLDVSSLNKGVYFVRVSTRQGEAVSRVSIN